MEEMKRKFGTLIVINWKIWIPANFMNFYLVPIPYQVLCSNFIALVYNAVLSYVTHH